jgi:hypothetical protein
MIVARAWTGLKPGVFDAPLRGFRGLTPVPAREGGISAVDGSSCLKTGGRDVEWMVIFTSRQPPPYPTSICDYPGSTRWPR